jgi:hypothetical protein
MSRLHRTTVIAGKTPAFLLILLFKLFMHLSFINGQYCVCYYLIVKKLGIADVHVQVGNGSQNLKITGQYCFVTRLITIRSIFQ